MITNRPVFLTTTAPVDCKETTCNKNNKRQNTSCFNLNKSTCNSF